MTRPFLVVVEGPMGAGKTTLAKALGASLSAPQLLECPGENPFLGEFYAAHHHALATELHFLLERWQQWYPLPAIPLLLSDHGPERDLLFSELTLAGAERDLYLSLRAALMPQPPAVDLMIFVDAPVNLLVQRIRQRAHPWDAAMTPDYVARIQALYRQWRQSYTGLVYDIFSDEMDFVGSSEHVIILSDLVRNTMAGKTL